MKKRCIVALFFVALTPLLATRLHAEDAPDPIVLEQERRLKDDTERQAQTICDSILGKNMANVLVNVELGLESTHKGGANLNRKLDNKSSLNDASNFLLPWVPAPKSVTKEETPKDASVATQAAQQDAVDVRTIVKRFDITVVHDKTIPAERIGLVKETLQSAFDRYKNVLKLFFKATSFVQKDFNPKETVSKNLWDSLTLKNLFLLFLLMLAFLLLKFFFGPLAKFMNDYIEGMKELSKSKVEMENKSETENETDENAETEQEGLAEEGALTPEEQAALEAEEEAMKKFVPFTYVNDENIRQLAYLLHHEEPWVVAMVLSYLTPEHGFRIMELMPADLQAKVALETAMYRQTSLEQVMAINEDIKQKIDFVVGGLDKLVGILENSDRVAQENILEYLKSEKPALYERVREQILLFEDIANFPKVAMQILVRELKTEELARALRGSSPELQQKFFENMSQGAVTLLKEEMEFGRPATEDQIAEERKKIVDLVKVMEKDGKLSFRQKGKNASMSGDEMAGNRSSITPRMATANPEESLAAYNEGLAAQEAGDIDTAVSHFERSVESDPNSTIALQALAAAYYSQNRFQESVQTYDRLLALEPNAELSAWVEELRASLSAAA